MATARPSSTRTRRRCIIRMGRVSAGAPWSRGERGDHSRSQCWAGAEKRREREKVLAEETRAPERETAACYTAPSPQPPGACCGSTLLGLQRILDIFSENCTDFCTHTHVHTQVCFFFFWRGRGGWSYTRGQEPLLQRTFSGSCRDLRKQGKYEDTYLNTPLLCPW